jgi:hypothetical protein
LDILNVTVNQETAANRDANVDSFR